MRFILTVEELKHCRNQTQEGMPRDPALPTAFGGGVLPSLTGGRDTTLWSFSLGSS